MQVHNTNHLKPKNPRTRMGKLTNALEHNPDVFARGDIPGQWEVKGMNGERWKVYISDKNFSAVESSGIDTWKSHRIDMSSKECKVGTTVYDRYWCRSVDHGQRSMKFDKMSQDQQFKVGLNVLGSLVGVNFSLYAPELAPNGVAAR